MVKKRKSVKAVNRSDESVQNNIDTSRLRRSGLRAAGLCINGSMHGPATHGTLCERCRITHRSRGRSLEQMEESP
jgi:hypothetical protein